MTLSGNIPCHQVIFLVSWYKDNPFIPEAPKQSLIIFVISPIQMHLQEDILGRTVVGENLVHTQLSYKYLAKCRVIFNSIIDP